MNLSANSRKPGWTAIAVVIAVAVAPIVAVPSIRESVLRSAGWALVLEEPVARADAIVVSLDSGGAGALEAADLVQSGIATKVGVFADPPSGEDHEFIRRGLPYENAGIRQAQQLRALGVTDVVEIPRIYAGTQGIGQALQAWCDRHHLRSIVFVAARDHSRRLRRVLDREMKGHPVHVMVRPSRYSSFDPDRWWSNRSGIRTEIVELQKLALEIVLHPMSLLD
jgi:hypothetical protein